MEAKQETKKKLLFALRGVLHGGKTLSEKDFEKYVESHLGDMTFDQCVEIIHSEDAFTVDSTILALTKYVLS